MDPVCHETCHAATLTCCGQLLPHPSGVASLPRASEGLSDGRRPLPTSLLRSPERPEGGERLRAANSGRVGSDRSSRDRTSWAPSNQRPLPLASCRKVTTASMAELGFLDQHLERMLASQQNEADNVSLMVTFFSAVAATLVGTALQVQKDFRLTLISSIVLGLSLLAVLVVVFVRRSVRPDEKQLFAESQVRGWDQEKLEQEFLAMWLVTAERNGTILKAAQNLAIFQVATSIIASLLAVLAIFSGQWGAA